MFSSDPTGNSIFELADSDYCKVCLDPRFGHLPVLAVRSFPLIFENLLHFVT